MRGKKCVTCAGAIVYENREKRMILIDFVFVIVVVVVVSNSRKINIFFVQVGKKTMKTGFHLYLFMTF